VHTWFNADWDPKSMEIKIKDIEAEEATVVDHNFDE